MRSKSTRSYQVTILLGLPFSDFANAVVWTGMLAILEAFFRTI